MSARAEGRREARRAQRQRELDKLRMAHAAEDVAKLPPLTDEQLDSVAALLDEIRTRHAQLAVEQRAAQQQLHNDEAITQHR